jgi:putative endopeptidase
MTLRSGWLRSFAALALLVPSFAFGATASAPATPAASAKKPAAAPKPAFSRANLDTTCAPCRDFFQYASGGWLKRAKIPSTQERWGSFDELAERNRASLYAILETAGKDKEAKPESDTGRLRDYWCACMDSAAAEFEGVGPIQPLLKSVDRLSADSMFAGEIAALQDRGIPALFFFRANQDPKHSDNQIAFAGQGGLGLPDRDYYVRQDSAAIETRRRYVEHIVNSLILLDRSTQNARAQADQILAIETALARGSMTAVQRRDPQATYHMVSADSLARLTPRFDWKTYFLARGIYHADSVNVTQPLFLKTVDSLMAAVKLDDWKPYLRWKVVNFAAPNLNQEFVAEDFSFQQVLTGAEALQPRWKRCLRAADQDLGDLLGKAYVAKKFPPAARDRALKMVRNLESALDDKITQLDWMGADTRQRAHQKLAAFERNIGYPNTWRDYQGVELNRKKYFDNRLSCFAYDSRRNLQKIGNPVDRGEWNMTPPTVNAFYSSSLNSINFPAGILQPPFFDPSWDDAMNYGGIGAVIGHEMSHGFDDRGRQFDDKGNLRDWWTSEDASRYQERARRVVEQFNGYTVLDTLHLNGRLTLGENIADLGGVAVAYYALEKALAGQPRKKIDGFTPEQRFFLAWAQVWREVMRPASMRTLVQTNPHSPPEWRVNGPLSNLPEFSKAWGCKDGDPMVRPQDLRARIW